MKAREFDKRFDTGEDISKYLDMTKARRPEQQQKRINVDFPLWMIHHQSLDRRPTRNPLLSRNRRSNSKY